jgi:hypothetical protein
MFVQMEKLDLCRVLFSEAHRGVGELLPLGRRSRQQTGIGARNTGHQQVAEIARQLTREMLQVVPLRSS